MLLTKAPLPFPSDVLLPLVAGFCNVPQQTPRTVMFPPPSLVIFPPDVAEFNVIPDTSEVVSTGRETAVVVKFISFPYAVPATFEA